MVAHNASAEYSSALPVGTYKVKATTIDDLGLESAATALVTFTVTTLVQKDRTLLWSLNLQVTKDVTCLWNVDAFNNKSLDLLWNTLILGPTVDKVLKWRVYPSWEDVPYEDTSPVPTWTEVRA